MTKRLIESTDRKRRPDAWEIKAGLSSADLQRVFAWARTLGYARALAMIKAELKIDPPGITAFSDWYDYYSRIESEQRVHRAVVDGAAVRELAEQCGDVSEAMTKALESEAAAAILGNDPERIKLLVGLALKARGGRRSDEALRLEIQKYQDSVQSAIEKGLAALAAKAKGNTKALQHYQAFAAAIRQSVSEVQA